MSSNPLSSQQPEHEAQHVPQDIWVRLGTIFTLGSVAAYFCLPIAYFFLAIQEGAPPDTFRLQFIIVGLWLVFSAGLFLWHGIDHFQRYGSLIIAVGLLLLLLLIAMIQLGTSLDAMSAFMLVIVVATLSPKLLELNTGGRNSEER